MRLQVKGSISRKGKYDLFMLALPLWSFLWPIVASYSFGRGSGVVIIGLLGIVAISALLKRKKIDKGLLDSWIWFFLMLLSRLPGSSINTVIIDGTMLFLGWLLSACVSNADINPKRTLDFLFKIGLFVAVMMLVDMATGLFSNVLFGFYNEISQIVKHRVTHGVSSKSAGIFAFSAMNGGFLICGLGAGIFLRRLKVISARQWYAAIVLFTVLILYISKRGFLLDLAIIFLFFKGFNFLIRPEFEVLNIKRVLSLIVVLFLFSGIYFTQDFVQDSVNNTVTRFVRLTEDDDTLSGRLPLYQLAVRQFIEHPVRGIGWGNYRALTENYLNQRSTYETHNVYLQLLCETGILGFATFMYAVFNTLLKTIRNYKKSVLGNNCEQECIFGFSLFLQMFFITYCMSGNPLYDYNFLLLYFSGVALMNYNPHKSISIVTGS